jgi:hypothetical protein
MEDRTATHGWQPSTSRSKSARSAPDHPVDRDDLAQTRRKYYLRTVDLAFERCFGERRLNDFPFQFR